MTNSSQRSRGTLPIIAGIRAPPLRARVRRPADATIFPRRPVTSQGASRRRRGRASSVSGPPNARSRTPTRCVRRSCQARLRQPGGSALARQDGQGALLRAVAALLEGAYADCVLWEGAFSCVGEFREGGQGSQRAGAFPFPDLPAGVPDDQVIEPVGPLRGPVSWGRADREVRASHAELHPGARWSDPDSQKVSRLMAVRTVVDLQIQRGRIQRPVGDDVGAVPVQWL